ncbi:hypothetical protein [Variovorax sp. HJSM1_2]|uniref:hypothetical protein n=1 Tax=Variovorax sp. HJSM1_2 TaxID=3366263 RepID=UPI003BB9D1DD
MPQIEPVANSKSHSSPSGGGRQFSFTGGVCVLVALVGLLVLSGWAFGLPLLRSVIPGSVEMKANTAMGLVMSVIALELMAS